VPAPTTLADILREFAGTTAFPRLNEEALTSVGTSASIFLRNRPTRVGALAVNLSLNQMWVWLDNTVSSTKGIRLAPSGGYFRLDWRVDWDLVGYEWWVIADGAASSFTVLEMRLEE
jgi:hypothetical protein